MAQCTVEGLVTDTADGGQTKVKRTDQAGGWIANASRGIPTAAVETTLDAGDGMLLQQVGTTGGSFTADYVAGSHPTNTMELVYQPAAGGESQLAEVAPNGSPVTVSGHTMSTDGDKVVYRVKP